MQTNHAPDGRNHYRRHTTANASVLVWTGEGDPHPDAFVYAVSVPTLAGMGNARLPKLSSRISSALAGWCADRVLPVARIDGALLFPVTAVQAWLAGGGRESVASWLAATGNITLFRRP